MSKKYYTRSLNQILQLLRRIRCLTSAMLLVSTTSLVLYLIRDTMAVQQTAAQSSMFTMRHPARAKQLVHDATMQVEVMRKEKCVKQENIVFTKTHKTGSSTLTNILLRYGEIHNKTQLLYKFPSSTEYRRLSEDKLLPGRSRANIFSQHATFNKSFLDSHILPDYKTFTILRSPVSQFLSAFSFFRKDTLYPAESFSDSIRLFFNSHNHDKYLTETWFCKNCGNLVNANAVDMGFSIEGYTKSIEKERFMKDFLREASSYYDLVLITEYFDLSLVLLKRRLCLEFEDILYLKSLERIKKEKVEDDQLLDRIAHIQRLDIVIYEHFNRTFWKEIAKEEGIFEELEVFQRLNKQVQDFCVKGSKVGYQGTYANELSEAGRQNFHCLAMNTRCLPFSILIEGRDDTSITDEERGRVFSGETSSYSDPDSLSYEQILHLDRHVDILDLAYRNRF